VVEASCVGTSGEIGIVFPSVDALYEYYIGSGESQLDLSSSTLSGDSDPCSLSDSTTGFTVEPYLLT
jgi:hypothetical protein